MAYCATMFKSVVVPKHFKRHSWSSFDGMFVWRNNWLKEEVSEGDVSVSVPRRTSKASSKKKGKTSLSPDEWLRKLEQEGGEDDDDKRNKKAKKQAEGNGDAENDRCSVATDTPRQVYKNPKTDVVGPSSSPKLGACAKCCVIC